MRILLLSWLFLIPFLANIFGIDMVLVSGQCQSDQRSSLLQLRSSLKFISSLSVNLVRWSQETDCCDWTGVHCDGAGRVTELDLSNESISSGLEKANGLFSLGYLRRLNLAYNRFGGVQIPGRLANLTNLTYLNLSNAGFGGQIPLEISGMTRLATLDLSSVTFLGSSLLKLEQPNLSVLVQNLTELRELYLDGVNLSANGNGWGQALSSSLPKLQVLSLSSCFLSGPIHHSLANLGLLSIIRLDQNDLSSPIPDFLADFSNLTSLRLSSCGLHGRIPEKIFQVPTLQILDFSNNQLLQGSFPGILKSHSLQTVMLSKTNFSGTLPYSIGNLKNLSAIAAANCNLNGPVPTSMANLTRLLYLDLSFNNFSGPIPSLHMSRNLTYVDLSYNSFTGVISSTSWEQLLNLIYVDLRFNFLNGSIPSSLFALPSVRRLFLSNNQFQGPLPEILNASSSVLDTLDVSGNRLEGPIPSSFFQLESLSILTLSSNKLNGTVQLDAIQQLHNLTKLDLSYNRLAVNASGGDASFPPKISTLRLVSCKLAKIPNLKTQSKLTYLDLSDNQISGEMPNWIWEVGSGGLLHLNLSHNLLVSLKNPLSLSNLTLTVLDLHCNQLQGEIPNPPPSVLYLDYSSNNFTFSIPDNIGSFISSSIFFSLANNSLTGLIPESICTVTSLVILNLSNNKLSGTMPSCLIKMSETLGVLNLKRNNLQGVLSDTFPEDCELQTLDLNGNQLQGIVPKSLANCKMLEVLDLGNNQMEDTFPCWLKNISRLRVLVLRSNRFYGNISCPKNNNDSWPMLQIVDIAHNSFSGRVPQKCLTTWKAMMVVNEEAQSEFHHLHFEFLHLGKLYYQDAVTVTSKGLEMEFVKILTVFTSIDLSSNKFEGPIPEEIGLFRLLYVLNLSYNAFTGPIPSAIGNLGQLESLDLSSNKLSGEIPSQLASLNFLSVLNLSNNHLVGKIPSGNQLQTFSNSSFENNDGLCGFPLTRSCSISNKIQPSLQQASSNEFDWQFIVAGVGFGVGSAAVVASLLFCKKANQLYDDQIDKFLIVILPMVGLTYTTSRERSLEADRDFEDQTTTDDDDDDDEMETEEFRGRYCVFCSKLDITKKKVIHDPKCNCHQSPYVSSSSSSSTSSSTSSSPHFAKG